ncbi:MAG: restriction endonuclease [Clostridia bacterium]
MKKKELLAQQQRLDEYNQNILNQFGYIASSSSANLTNNSLPRQTTAQKLAEIEKMDNIQFEFYLSRIFTYKGCTVKFTPVIDDYGADMVVEKGGVVTAVRCLITKEILGCEVVYDSLKALSAYSCDQCMVITNGYFNSAAVKHAKGKKIVLVDKDTLIEDFINIKLAEQLETPKD